MARTISPTKTLNFRDRDLLRAIYYHQGLPKELLAFGTDLLSARLAVLEMGGYLKKTNEQFELTDAGALALKRMYGGRKPPMIDMRLEALLDPKEKKSYFLVGSSLARKLAREVSGGE
jgi:hypothetical protein